MAGFYCVNDKFMGSRVAVPVKVTHWIVFTFPSATEATCHPSKGDTIFCCETFGEALAEAHNKQRMEILEVFVIRQMTINHY